MSRISFLTTLSLLSFSSAALSGAAFQIYSQSANSMGYAHSDMAALAADASTAWYNPAGMTKLCNPELCFGGSLFMIKEEFNSKVGFSSLTDLLVYEKGVITTIPAQSFEFPFRAERALGTTWPLFPSINVVYPIHYYDLHFAFGLAVDCPWGLETDYSYSHVSSYAEQTLIESVQINPSIAIGFGGLSFAVGYGREFLETKFTTAVINTGAYFKLNGWENTYNLAFLYEVDPTLTVGATYRPGITHRIKGSSSLMFNDASATCRFKTPGVLTGGFKYDISRRWSLLGTVGYNLWSQVKEIKILTGIPQIVVNPKFLGLINTLIQSLIPSPPGPFPPGTTFSLQNVITLNTGEAIIHINGKDTLFLAIGSKYDASDMWTVKMGFAYDQSPIRSGSRELHIPDNDHYLFSVGARCNFNDCVFADIGLEYIFTPKCGIKNNPILPVSSVPATLAITLPGGEVIDLPINNQIMVPKADHGFSGPISTTAIAFGIQVGVIFP